MVKIVDSQVHNCKTYIMKNLFKEKFAKPCTQNFLPILTVPSILINVLLKLECAKVYGVP